MLFIFPIVNVYFSRSNNTWGTLHLPEWDEAGADWDESLYAVSDWRFQGKHAVGALLLYEPAEIFIPYTRVMLSPILSSTFSQYAFMRVLSASFCSHSW